MEIRFTISRETVAAFGTPEFESYLFHELASEHEHELELTVLCQNAGWPEDGVSFDELVVNEQTGATVKGGFKASIIESTGDTCSRLAEQRRRSGLMAFSLNLSTCEMELNHCPWEQREYDPEEF